MSWSQLVLPKEETNMTNTSHSPDTGPRCIDWGVASETLRSLRRRKELDQFLEDWRGGRCKFTMEPPELIEVIAKLIKGFDEAGVLVRSLKWPSPPSDEQLKDPDEYVGECVAEARFEQEAAKRQRGFQNVMNHALVRAGQEPASDGLNINPVHLQNPRYSLEELAERLTATIARHEAERGGFIREYLDPKATYYIPVKDGGIANKQVSMMVNMITGHRKHRRFDLNWRIVTDWLFQQGRGDYRAPWQRGNDEPEPEPELSLPLPE
jgi:hypothetical protein